MMVQKHNKPGPRLPSYKDLIVWCIVNGLNPEVIQDLDVSIILEIQRQVELKKLVQVKTYISLGSGVISGVLDKKANAKLRKMMRYLDRAINTLRRAKMP